MQDSSIITLFRQRSERAIEALERKYGAACSRTANNIIGNREDAEECVNDSYLAVWNTIPPQEPDPLVAYVLRIVRNISLKRVQHNAAAKRAGNYQECYEELSGCIASHDTPESIYNARQVTAYIEDFLYDLSSTNRYLFVRRYWYLDSTRDLAKATGMAEGAVRTRLSRLRQQLKEVLLEKEVLL